MGVVWAAVEVASGEARALKFLKDDEDPKAHARLLREARAASEIRHPNVARVLEVGELEDGQPFLVMDLLDGETLAARLAREGALPLAEIARLFGQVIDAVEAAHARRIVHRDLKPDNVFLVAGAGACDVRVLDFGIAKDVARDADGSTSLTATGAMIGTPHYMAPEQIFGDSDVDARADVWALGVMLYECAAGKRPTTGSGVGQVLKIIATDAIAPLDAVAPGAPRELTAILSRMLARDRDARPTLAQLRTVLEGLEGGPLSALAARTTDGTATLDTETPRASRAPARTPPPRPVSSNEETPERIERRKWLFGTLGLSALATFTWFALTHRAPAATTAPPDTVDAAIASVEDASTEDHAVARAEPAAPDAAVVLAPPPPHRRAVPAQDAGVAPRVEARGDAVVDAGVSASVDAGTSVNILSHDRT